MKCPHCGELLEEHTCSGCNRTVPEDSRYCCWCGKLLAVDDEPQQDEELPKTDDEEGPIDFANRTLCSDGACIGVIGLDGRCKECGKAYTGEPEEG